MINPKLLEKARLKGTDEEYLDWLRKNPSALLGVYSEVVDGEGYCEAAHVRRASDSGTAYKPEYSAIPLTHEEHAMQHQKGESVFCPPKWYENKATEYLVKWVNGVKPPRIKEAKSNWKETFIIEYPGQIVALWLLVKKHFSNKDAKHIKLTIEPAAKQRSNKQNKAQWGLVYKEAIDYYVEHPIALAADMISSIRFGIDENSIHEMFKRLFLQGKSTANLDTIASNEYMDKIREHFYNRDGYIISKPKEDNYGDD
jgi:hypothetical protein